MNFMKSYFKIYNKSFDDNDYSKNQMKKLDMQKELGFIES